MSLFESKESAIGLEIGTYSVRAVELKKATPYKLTHYATEELGNGVVADGEIIEAEDVVQALKRLWTRGRFTTKKVVLGIANPKVLIRQVELPYMEDTALRNAINFQAQEYIPFPPEELILDYHVLGRFEGEDKQDMQEVLLVAAHREMVLTFCQAVEKAGLHVETVYLSALALARSLFESIEDKVLIGNNEENTSTSVVITNIGADLTNIVVVEKGFARFARIMTIGGNDFTSAISDSLGIPLREAEEIKKSTGIFDGADQDNKQKKVKQTPETESKERVVAILQGEANKFITELRRSIEYYFGEDIHKQPIEKIILTGGGAEMVGFDEYITERLKIKTEKGNALNQVDISKHINEGLLEEMRKHEPSLGVVVGLAMRGIE